MLFKLSGALVFMDVGNLCKIKQFLLEEFSVQSWLTQVHTMLNYILYSVKFAYYTVKSNTSISRQDYNAVFI